MEVYLPVAELSVNWAMILAMGAAVGFLSGMFGVGGGFLMTPLLVFYGIPPGIAVATQASHITASSLSGALAQWRRQGVDAKMGLMLLGGGLLGSAAGVYVFRILQQLGQIELVVTGSYVVLLGSIGGLMLNESIRTMRAARKGEAPAAVRTGQHSWIHGLPFKMRFRRSKLYISIIPPLVLGVLVGVLTAIMGVGGGFIMVPAMIYLLRMPTNVVIGTSQFQILFVTAATTILHATSDQTVDIVLAFLLVLGGVVGVQFGVRLGSQLRGEQLRALLAILVVAVAIRLFVGLVVTPSDIYSIVAGTP
ncbi:MAG TPA: sulfite exporter TauE/SafE family protein [Micropepsaceae bacterium]|nr:sulfite exporter TauE/SafE family protein [Micropepsaceae bacterium]